MSEIADKVKEKIKGAKDKVTDTGKETRDRLSDDDRSSYGGTGAYEEGAPGTERGRKDDPLTSYREKEPMSPAKIKEHEPTAVKREMTEKIVEPGHVGTNAEEAA